MSRDAEIMDVLKTRLQTILISGGYQTNIGQKVYIWRTSPLGSADVPALLISDQEIEHDTATVMGMSRNSMTVEAVIVLSGASSLSDARKARADLKKCISGFDTAGGLANRMLIAKSAIEMKQFEDLVAGATAQIIIEYDTTRDAI